MTVSARARKTKYESVYTTEEFARLYGCSLRQVQNLCAWGRAHKGVDSYRVGERGLRIPKAELDRLRKERDTAAINHAAPSCAAAGGLA